MTEQTTIEPMINQEQFDKEYNQLNSKLEDIFNEYTYLGNVVLLALASECVNGIVAQKQCSIDEAKLRLIQFITSLQFINTATMN